VACTPTNLSTRQYGNLKKLMGKSKKKCRLVNNSAADRRILLKFGMWLPVS